MTQDAPEQAGNIAKFKISSNFKGNAVDMSAAVQEFNYYESVLSNTITATAIIMESGFETSDGKKATPKQSTLDGLPIRGGERTDILITDTRQNELTFPKGLYINRVRDSVPGTQTDLYSLDFGSREYFANDMTRVVKRYEGKISDHVESILKDLLKVDGKVDIDPTAVPYNFIGNDKKPFYTCTWLASKAIPEDGGSGGGDAGSAIGGAAGFLFYQTRDGFHFKSIDKLFAEKPVKKYIFNNASQSNLPAGYDEKIISYTIDSDVDLNKNLLLGQYNNRSIFFNFLSFNYELVEYSVETDQQEKITTAGTVPIAETVAKEFTESPSRLMTQVLDVGTLPPGKDMCEQLKQWKDEPTNPNYQAADTMVQSIMRYNQMFTIKTNITIPGDFTLKAGDIIKCDFPELKGEKNKEKNPESGGIYMIAHVCHRITPRDTYTSLGLVRDSFGTKKGGKK